MHLVQVVGENVVRPQALSVRVPRQNYLSIKYIWRFLMAFLSYLGAEIMTTNPTANLFSTIIFTSGSQVQPDPLFSFFPLLCPTLEHFRYVLSLIKSRALTSAAAWATKSSKSPMGSIKSCTIFFPSRLLQWQHRLFFFGCVCRASPRNTNLLWSLQDL